MTRLSGVVDFSRLKKSGEWWKDRVICGDSERILHAMPDDCVQLAITSPPYNVGLEYDSHDDRMRYEDYLTWLTRFWAEIYRVLVPGGRFALNIAPTSIKDFRPVHYDMARDLMKVGFIMRTEILWYKQTMRRRTAWGSWRSPRNPHMVPSWEYVLVFSKGSWTLEGDKADIDITRDEFIKYSDAFWQIQPETRGRQPFLKSLYPPRKGRKPPTERQDGHPAPFPEELIKRLVKFYSYRGNTVLDPFGGTGTVAAIARRYGRHFVHMDLSKRYCAIAADRVAAEALPLLSELESSVSGREPVTDSPPHGGSERRPRRRAQGE